MGLDDKIENTSEDMQPARPRRRPARPPTTSALRPRARPTRRKADLKQAGEKVKDAFRD